jgi:hypothetical protein
MILIVASPSHTCKRHTFTMGIALKISAVMFDSASCHVLSFCHTMHMVRLSVPAVRAVVMSSGMCRAAWPKRRWASSDMVAAIAFGVEHRVDIVL